ncbi:MAG: FAD:protein FMN transferase [Gammaproteobacteria bacterium]|nr:FAD:protein FMN transferase [Gammaproteobacteria bacterium]
MKLNKFFCNAYCKANKVIILKCFGIAWIFLFLGSCGGSSDVLYKEQLFVFGTIVEISIWGQHQKSKQAAAVIAEDFRLMHRILDPWKGGSLARMNEIFPSNIAFSVSPAVLPLILKAKELSAQSNGLFNPAIGKLIKLWSFDDPNLGLKLGSELGSKLGSKLESKLDSHSDKRVPPDAKLISDLVSQNPTMNNVLINGISIRSDHSELALDFGAIAKGYAVDMAIYSLQDAGIKNAIINAGGDLRAIGKHGDRNWLVGVRHPRENDVIASIEIDKDESVFTSGDYERFFEHGGKRYHHIIDPRTGYPAEDVVSVTVIHSNATIADAAATALFIAGPKQWYSIAKSMGVKWVMLIDKKLNVYMNPAMAKRLKFEPKKIPNIILSPPL